MTRGLRGYHSASAVAVCAAVFAAGCAASKPAARPSTSGSRAQALPPCSGTLGIEAAPMSPQARKGLGLSDRAKGAIVIEVVPGGPAEAAGVRSNDVVEQVGAAHIANDCEFSDAAYSRSCEPVRVVLRRAGATVETKLVPVDQESFYEQSCRNLIASACFRRAWLLWSRNGESDRDRALGLYDAACRAGSAEACAYGGLHSIDDVKRRNDAVSMLARSCELGSGAGCAHLAFLYATGRLVGKDDRRAASLYVKACDLGDAPGCYNVGLMADEGRGGVRDRLRAVAKYDEACELGSSTACTNLGFLYEHGRGVERDSARAFALYQRGCAGTSCQPSNLGGCLNVGRARRDGIGVEKNPARAAAIFQDACDRKPHPRDVHADENRSRACSLLGALYLAGDGVERDRTRGRELSELGCERGDSFGCYNAAVIFTSGEGVEKDVAKAASFLERACSGGDGEGCHDLGVAYEKGTGVTRDRRRATALYRKACELGFSQACVKKRR